MRILEEPVRNMDQKSMSDAIAYQMDLLHAKSNRMQREEKVYQKVSELMQYGFFYEDLQENTEFAVGEWDEILGFQQDEYENIVDFLKNIDQYDEVEILNQKEKGEDVLYRELKFSLKNKKNWVSNIIWLNRDHGQIAERISCFRNISSFKQQNEELEFLAYYDMVTGLYNRNYFVKELTDILLKEESAPTYNTISVVCMCINDFKKINEAMGMVAGDEVLQEVGLRLRSVIDERMVATRIGGGEFCIAIPDASGKRGVTNIVALISEQLKEPFYIPGYEPVRLDFSFGVAEYPEAGSSAIELIRNAQIVLKSARAEGRNSLKFYDYQLVNSFMEKLTMEQNLKEALEQNQFELFFQPQYDVHTRKLRGAETLLRWRREDGQFVPNNLYIPIAEQSGEILRIGKWVLREAIGLLAKWEREMDFQGILSINASAVQLKQEDFVPHVLSLMEEFQIKPSQLEIEITESVVMEDLELIVGKLRLLRRHGVKVSLDDFGTGFSSLTYLKDLPIDTLKIDKTFIDSVITDSSTNIITQSVVEMVRQLGLETVAEGVETEEQYQFLEDIQCDNIQGYLLGKPMPEPQFVEVYKKERELSVQ